MADATDIDFTTRAGTPTTIEVTAHDGKTYEIRVAVAIVTVRDEHELQDSPYGPIPKLQVQFQLAIDTRPQGQAPIIGVPFGGKQ